MKLLNVNEKGLKKVSSSRNLFNLSGKVAIITGASRGLGKAMALGLSERGVKVVVTDVLDVKGVVGEIKKRGREALGLKVDVSKKKSVVKMVQQAVKKFKRVDILINNAGILRAGPAEKMSEKDWDDVIKINLKGQFLCAQEVGKRMIKQKSGRIINIASIAGKMAFNQAVSYDASKAGIILITKDLAIEWGKYGVLVNAICPGVFATKMTEGFLRDKGFLQMVKARVPLGRYAKPEELVGAAIFLASDASSYVNGHALVVDGGWTAGL
jgi:NAD(P)-dependent dehydrogenase (short-subunit alcohol dehydrogenase family)